MKNLYQKYLVPHLDIIAYAFWGVVTTLTNLITYYLCFNIIGIEYYTSSIIAWVAAIVVAYLTNRKWVFHSEAKGFSEISQEILRFIGSRLVSLALEIPILYLGKDILNIEENLTKYAATFIVIILNYILSKFFVFQITSSTAKPSSKATLNKVDHNRPKSPHPKD